ncbi:F0F1 ATP synthase subunit delta [Candidatus Kaiserbacteria bacterium]|nr:F0F1 ATP synthase subunit delta [Candidatus Kaiserbacteria bacterium]
MEKAYAQALWKMITDGMPPKKAVHALHDLLKAHGRVELMSRVGKALVRIAERASRRTDVVVSVAREQDERKAQIQAKEVLKELGMEAKDLKTQVDDTLIGGWRLEGKEHLVDASYKKYLLDMYNRVTT